jgi:hypothetical protein
MAIKDAVPAIATGDPHKLIADLEARVAKLENVLRIGVGGSVTLRATSISIEADRDFTTKAGGSITIKSSGPMVLKGSKVDIN